VEDSLMLHVVTSGKCLLEVEGTPNRLLHQGDLALVPHGKGHVVTSAHGLPVSNLFEIQREQVSERYESLRLAGEGEHTAMICGLFKFDDPAAQQLITLLPKVIVVDAWSSPQSEWIQSTLRMVSAEAKAIKRWRGNSHYSARRYSGYSRDPFLDHSRLICSDRLAPSIA
jgi:hypothetical protein